MHSFYSKKALIFLDGETLD
uniref:Uncharacterized protein n=1 Tax=Arundo donax TaxID=35708 RepID=A0A0A9H7C7_ARUDO